MGSGYGHARGRRNLGGARVKVVGAQQVLSFRGCCRNMQQCSVFFSELTDMIGFMNVTAVKRVQGIADGRMGALLSHR